MSDSNPLSIIRTGGTCDNLWHFACGTFDPSDRHARLYFDGEPALASVAVAFVPTVKNDPEGLLLGGGIVGAGYFQGQIDEVAMWDRCLTAAEVAGLYNGGAGFRPSLESIRRVFLSADVPNGSVVPAPHQHTAEELGFDSRFYRRGERVPTQPHSHLMADVADLRPDDAQFVLASRVFGG